MSKNTYLPLILTKVGYGKQMEHTSNGLSNTFQTMGRQSDFCPNHKWVICNYPKKKKKLVDIHTTMTHVLLLKHITLTCNKIVINCKVLIWTNNTVASFNLFK